MFRLPWQSKHEGRAQHPKPKGEYQPGSMKDFVGHDERVKEQNKNLGMEAAKTHEEKVVYIRKLARGIFEQRLDARPTTGGRIGSGESGMISIPEWDRIFDVWRDFPQAELEAIVKEEFVNAHVPEEVWEEPKEEEEPEEPEQRVAM